MSLNQIIKKVIREQTENVIMLTPEEFKENLLYFNSDVALLKRYYKNKDIIIKGNLDLYNNQIYNIASQNLELNKIIKLYNLNHYRDFLSVNDICYTIYFLWKKN